MLPRERVHAALRFQTPDQIPLQIHGSPGGLYEHGPNSLNACNAWAMISATCQTWFHLGGGGSIWERLSFLHGYEDSLVKVQLDTPEVNRLADQITEHCAGCIAHALATGADGVAFGDDFGTQQALLFPPAVWRRFFNLLDDFAELGVTAIWPHLPLFDLPELARRCRDLHLAVQLHPDRGDLMHCGNAQQVRDYLSRLLETLDSAHGGSWLYIEIDPASNGKRWKPFWTVLIT